MPSALEEQTQCRGHRFDPAKEVPTSFLKLTFIGVSLIYNVVLQNGLLTIAKRSLE